jgi:hypothetical protein
MLQVSGEDPASSWEVLAHQVFSSTNNESAYKLWTQQDQAFWSYRPNKRNSRRLLDGHIENGMRPIFERNLPLLTINQHTNFELNRAKHSEVIGRTTDIQDGCLAAILKTLQGRFSEGTFFCWQSISIQTFFELRAKHSEVISWTSEIQDGHKFLTFYFRVAKLADDLLTFLIQKYRHIFGVILRHALHTSRSLGPIWELRLPD